MPMIRSLSLTPVIALAVGCGWTGEATRDPWLWPFATDSIWNTPIGDGADYQAEGHFTAAHAIGADVEFHFKVSAQAPVRKLYQPMGWPVIDGQHGKFFREWRIDDDAVVRTQISNNCAAFLMPDGHTLEQLEPFIRMTAGGDVLGIPNPFTGGIELTGSGVIGTHWGSGLSAFGGALRHGELTGDIPIRHALKINVFCRKYLSFDRATKTPGWRWPATNADGYAGDAASDGHYQGRDPRVAQGALLAIPPRHTASALGLKTKPGRTLFHALQDYGAYIVDDSASDAYHLCPSYEACGEFREVFGHPIAVDARATGAAREWYDDVMTLMAALAVVDNNRPDTIGGGGKRRAGMAPTLGGMDTIAPSPPGKPSVTATSATSVTLAWSASHDQVRICGYHILAQGVAEPLGETFGHTQAEITGLKPGSTYTFTVRAYDTGLNRSALSATVIATTKAVAQGTLLEDFDAGVADGWMLEGAAVRSKRLELARWDGATRALCTGTDLPQSFTFSARIDAIGGAPANIGRILVRHHGTTWGSVEFGGGPLTPVILQQTVEGKRRVLATAVGWSADHFSLTCDATGAISLVLTKDGTARTVFDHVANDLPRGGHIGFETQNNTVYIDDVRVLPDGKAP